MKKETLQSFVMEKAETTKFCNEKSEHYKNFVREKCEHLIYKESRFCGEGQLVVCMVDGNYIKDHVSRKWRLPGIHIHIINKQTFPLSTTTTINATTSTSNNHCLTSFDRPQRPVHLPTMTTMWQSHVTRSVGLALATA